MVRRDDNPVLDELKRLVRKYYAGAKLSKHDMAQAAEVIAHAEGKK